MCSFIIKYIKNTIPLMNKMRNLNIYHLITPPPAPHTENAWLLVRHIKCGKIVIYFRWKIFSCAFSTKQNERTEKKRHEFLNEFMFGVINDPDVNIIHIQKPECPYCIVYCMWMLIGWTVGLRYKMKLLCTRIREIWSVHVRYAYYGLYMCVCATSLRVWIILWTIHCIVLPKILLCPFTQFCIFNLFSR